MDILVTWHSPDCVKECKMYNDAEAVAKDFNISTSEVIELCSSNGFLNDFEFEFAQVSDKFARKVHEQVFKKGVKKGSLKPVGIDVCAKTFIIFDSLSDLCSVLAVEPRLAFNILNKKTSKICVNGYLIMYEKDVNFDGLKPVFDAINV